MAIGIVGRKLGMTRVFTDTGESIPVTVIHAEPNRVTQIKSLDTDGYRALQVTAGERKASRLSKPQAGHFAKAGVEAGCGLWEFALALDEESELAVGAEINVDMFEEGQAVDVTGVSKGKGFAGTIKRHNFHGQDRSHGNSLSHRVAGATGQCQTPGRVFRGKKMAGRMGDTQCTTQNLHVVRIDKARNLLLIGGSVAGARGGDVIVKPATKAVPKN